MTPGLQDSYDDKFETKNGKSEKLKAAFNQVSDIRKFEIDLYWKRAGYFWALIAAAFAGYFAILSSQHITSQFFLSFIVGAIGFVFTFAWYLVNIGLSFGKARNWPAQRLRVKDKPVGKCICTLCVDIARMLLSLQDNGTVAGFKK